MPVTAEPIAATSEPSLHQQVTDALQNQTLPISKLLRLMWALDVDQSAVNDTLRTRLRARIGAPLDA